MHTPEQIKKMDNLVNEIAEVENDLNAFRHANMLSSISFKTPESGGHISTRYFEFYYVKHWMIAQIEIQLATLKNELEKISLSVIPQKETDTLVFSVVNKHVDGFVVPKKSIAEMGNELLELCKLQRIWQLATKFHPELQLVSSDTCKTISTVHLDFSGIKAHQLSWLNEKIENLHRKITEASGDFPRSTAGGGNYEQSASVSHGPAMSINDYHEVICILTNNQRKSNNRNVVNILNKLISELRETVLKIEMNIGDAGKTTVN